MKQSTQDQLQKITPLIKIVKNRQQLYLQLLNFITKNIESSSNQHQQLNIFTKFLSSIKTLQKQIIGMEKDICKRLESDGDEGDGKGEGGVVNNVMKNSKQILRLCSRLIEILDASLSKTRNSLFNQDNRLMLQFQRFKRHLHNIIKGQTVHLGEFTTHILNFIKIKYKKQLAKIQKYVFKLESGAIVALKELYMKERSDDQEEIGDKVRYGLRQQQSPRAQLGSETDSPQKKSLKKPLLAKSTKKGHKLYKSTKKQLSIHSDTKPPKQYTATKLLKFYQMMQLSKKQFFQDMIYDKLQEQEHKKKLMNSLLQRNKTISGQISTFYKKTLVYHQKIRQVGNYVSSGEEKELQKSPKEKKSSQHQSHSMLKNNSLRKSFVISKRKSSLNFQKNSKILTQHDQSPSPDVFIKTVKHLPVKRKSSNQTTQRSLTNKSKKLFVIKSPVVFQDDNIPQAPTVMNGQGWYRPPLTTRKSQKKNENLRLKRRNNPLPIQNSLFNQSFKFSENVGGSNINSNRFG